MSNLSQTSSFTTRLLSLGSIALLGLALAGCSDNNTGARGNTVQGNVIKIGQYASLTGGTATFGTETNEGIELAIAEANAAGGVNGKQFQLVTEDDQSKPEIAQTVVTKLITQDKVVAVLGEVASTRSIRGGTVCQQYHTPMISPSSTNPEVTKKGDCIFRVCFTDDFQAAADAKFAYDQGFRNVAIYKDIKNDYSVAFAKNFVDTFTKLGGKIAGESTYSEGDTDFKAALNSIKGSSVKADAILVPGYYTEVGTIARQAKEIGLNAPLIGGDGWDSPKLVPGAGTALEGSFFSDHYFSTELKEPEMQEFIKNYKAKYNKEPGVLAALGYDSAKLLVDAVKRAKTMDGTGIRDAIAETKDFPGVAGKITIDANRNARKSALIMQIKGASFKVFKAVTPEQVGL